MRLMKRTTGLVLLGLVTAGGVGTGSLTHAESTNAATKRPIEDFLNAQTLGDIVDWISNSSQTDPSYRTRIDFTGAIHRLFVQPNGADFGTTFSGDITERPLGDGRYLSRKSR